MDHYRVTLGLKLEEEVERKKHEHVEQEVKGILKLEIVSSIDEVDSVPVYSLLLSLD